MNTRQGHQRPRNTRTVFNCPVAHGEDHCRHDATDVVGNDPLRAKASDRRRIAAAEATRA